MTDPSLCLVNAPLHWDGSDGSSLMMGPYRLGHVSVEQGGQGQSLFISHANGRRIGAHEELADAKHAVEAIVARLAGVATVSRDGVLAAAEQAIYDAPLALTGDPMGVLILDSEFIHGQTVHENIAQVRQICREVAEAVLRLPAQGAADAA